MDTRISTLMDIQSELEQRLLAADHVAAKAIISKLGLDQANVIDQIITPVLEHIGEKWEKGEIALSQIYMSGMICEDLLKSLLPGNSQIQQKPKAAIVTFEDYHSLGKRIVLSMLCSYGISALDYGHGVTIEKLVPRIQQDQIQILLISTLMLPSALHIRELRARFQELGLHIKIIVGGAPFRFDHNLWKEVGADAMGNSAVDAVRLIRKFLEADAV